MDQDLKLFLSSGSARLTDEHVCGLRLANHTWIRLLRAPEDRIDRRISQAASKAQYEGDARNQAL